MVAARFNEPRFFRVACNFFALRAYYPRAFTMTEFEQLYERYAADVHRFSLYLSGDPAQAQDITSETFVRVWTAQGRIRVATVKAYLFTIARNLYLQMAREAARREVLDERIADPQPSPEEQSESRSDLRIVLRALQQLPEVDRTALLMRTQDEMSYEEIARALQITVAAAKVKIHRARLKLAASIDKRRQHASHP